MPNGTEELFFACLACWHADGPAEQREWAHLVLEHHAVAWKAAQEDGAGWQPPVGWKRPGCAFTRLVTDAYAAEWSTDMLHRIGAAMQLWRHAGQMDNLTHRSMRPQRLHGSAAFCMRPGPRLGEPSLRKPTNLSQTLCRTALPTRRSVHIVKALHTPAGRDSPHAAPHTAIAIHSNKLLHCMDGSGLGLGVGLRSLELRLESRDKALRASFPLIIWIHG